MEQLHVLKVRAYTRGGAKVQIESEYWEQTIRIPFNNEPGATQPAIETAEKYLLSQGFELIGRSLGKGHRHYIVAKNFLKLK